MNPRNAGELSAGPEILAIDLRDFGQPSRLFAQRTPKFFCPALVPHVEEPEQKVASYSLKVSFFPK
jgi:hypothetical protein